ncbi:MAG: PQQ-binding-like beta-propeller repeat protein [Anaerolineaceae bacterium]
MKKPLVKIILLFLISAALLAGCAMGPRAESAPGLSADEDAVYVSYLQHVYKVDNKAGTELWRYPAAGSAQVVIYAPPLLHEGSVFIGDLANKFHKLDAANGSETWSFAEGKGWFQAKAATNGDVIVAPSSDRNVYALNPDGSLKWKYSGEFGFIAEPLILEDSVIVAGLDHNLLSLDLETGEQQWVSVLKGALIAAPAYDPASGSLFVGSLGNEMLSIDSKTGKVNWTFGENGEITPIYAAPVLVGESLLFADESGKVFALNPASGTVEWTLDAGGETVAGILPLEDSFVIALEKGDLRAYKLADRTPLWTRTLDGNLYTTPVVSADKIVVAVTKGQALLQAYDLAGNPVWSFTPAN